MLDCKAFYDVLTASGVDFFAGVPDSLLKDFCAFVTDNTPPERNIITANEGGAVSLAAGHYLATGRPGLVYMQNSGLGNTVNPLTSLADPAVYGIPVLLVVGWRGEPGVKDEPQHVKMGAVTPDVLGAIDVPYVVLPDDLDGAKAAVADALAAMERDQRPYALVVKKGLFAKYKLINKTASPYDMTREEAISVIVDGLPADALVVSTTGKPSRELFELREQRGQSHQTDFLTVGSMGHSSQIALGVALDRRDRTVLCLDGDGAVIMHMGGLATIGTSGARNYKHVVVNNGAHDSVGGQPTCAFAIDITKVATACGYTGTWLATNRAELDAAWPEFLAADGPVLLEVRVKIGARDDLGRPTMTPQDLKHAFMGAIRG
ncbi:MAG: phosphonopyruvate decarboxylase [Deltaproteobacteria bacterium HGW-Deltaproteobacteria-14]|jgi:phosphonopyruvate decarboxylase|nr:MAG: phosphonopyruvate decarboxylase [Deltaproteobacteria bacterium HGW-Deltaproteobacteria-14]